MLDLKVVIVAASTLIPMSAHAQQADWVFSNDEKEMKAKIDYEESHSVEMYCVKTQSDKGDGVFSLGIKITGGFQLPPDKGKRDPSIVFLELGTKNVRIHPFLERKVDEGYAYYLNFLGLDRVKVNSFVHEIVQNDGGLAMLADFPNTEKLTPLAIIESDDLRTVYSQLNTFCDGE